MACDPIFSGAWGTLSKSFCEINGYETQNLPVFLGFGEIISALFYLLYVVFCILIPL